LDLTGVIGVGIGAAGGLLKTVNARNEAGVPYRRG